MPAEKRPSHARLQCDSAPREGVWKRKEFVVHRRAKQRGFCRRVQRVAMLLCVAAAMSLVGAVSALAASPPSIEDESVANVSSTSATLKARINPGESATSYHFEYGLSTSYGASVPLSEGEITASPGSFSVEAHVQGLSQLTTYHFRVVATNAEGSESGADSTFATDGAGGPLILPDGRQWELVSPPNKHGALVEAGREEGGAIQAAVDGSAIVYYASAPVTGEEVGSRSPEATSVLSARTSSGWATEDLSVPHDEPNNVRVGHGTEYKAFSQYLTLGLFEPNDFMQLTPETTEWTPYIRESVSAALQPLLTASDVAAGTEFGEEVSFEAASPNLDHVVLWSEVPLTENAVGGGLYEWSADKLELVSVLPGPEAKPAIGGGELYAGDGIFKSRGREIHAVSADGSRIVFHGVDSETGHTHLYLRDTSLQQTIQVDVGGEKFAPEFWAANADDTRIFFEDGAVLAPGAVEGRANLYECAVVVAAGKLTCELSDVAAGINAHGLIGLSEDGSYVYFMSGEGEGEIYVAHEGAVKQVVAIGKVSPSYFGSPDELTARVSPNGRYLAFVSTLSLTGYDNRDATSGARDTEVYLYDSSSEKLTCVSCNPTGERPQGFEVKFGVKTAVNSRGSYRSGTWLSGTVPGWIKIGTGGKSLHQPRYLADNGTLFFNSTEALVPQDVNGLEDVYEYEPEGIGKCDTAGGCVGLISSGSSQEESVFMDASESGNDAFFVTSKPLVAKDEDHAIDMYDAHVCSAEAPCISEPVLPPPCESSDGCKGAPSTQPEVFGAPSSATFGGEGNLTPSRGANKAQSKGRLRRALRRCAAKHRHNRQKRIRCKRRVRRRWRRGHGGKAAAHNHHRKIKATRRGNGR